MTTAIEKAQEFKPPAPHLSSKDQDEWWIFKCCNCDRIHRIIKKASKRGACMTLHHAGWADVGLAKMGVATLRPRCLNRYEFSLSKEGIYIGD